MATCVSRKDVFFLIAFFGILYLSLVIYGLGVFNRLEDYSVVSSYVAAVPEKDTKSLMEAVAQAAQQPVLIGIVGGSGQWPFLQAIQGKRLTPEQPIWNEKNCSWHGVPITCVFTINQTQFPVADGLYFHIPSKPNPAAIMPRQHPKQIRFGISLESSIYYSWLDDPKYMCNFEAEATYRSCSQVQQTMHHETNHDFTSGINMVHLPELPYEQKDHAVAYINSNCGTHSNRAGVLREWMNLGTKKMRVHSFGRCDNNKPWPQNGSRPLTKREIFNRYTFCIAMENSIAYDYVTEKVWDALSAGCVPIYMGSPTIFSIVPDPYGLIMYGPGGNASTVAELDALVHRLGCDKATYNKMVEWKHRKVGQLSPGYQEYFRMISMTNECRLCTHIVNKRTDNSFSKDTTCLWNETWLKAAGKPFHNVTC